MTGLEVMAGRLAAQGVSRAVGGLLPSIGAQVGNLRTLGRVRSARTRQFRSESTTTDTATAVVSLFDTAEIESCAVSLAAAYFLKECGSDPETRVNDLRNAFIQSARLQGPRGSDITAVASQAFELLHDNVVREVHDALRQNSGVSPSLRAAVLRSAAHHASAITRNAEMLAQMQSLSEVAEFQAQARAQAQFHHATMRLPHIGETRRVPYADLFVTPKLRMDPASPKTDFSTLSAVLLRIVVLGAPGAGKSTLASKYAFDTASIGTETVPFLVGVREYANQLATRRLSIHEYIHSICKVSYSTPPPDGAIDYLLLNGRAVVLFDGLDEVEGSADRARVVEAVEGFALRYPTLPILVTSREVGYQDAPLATDLFTTASLCEFENSEVTAYSRKWFNLDEAHAEPQRRALSKSFLADSELVQDLRRNPLMLSLLCSMYSRTNYIPTNRPEVYERCTLLLFREWDRLRGIDSAMAFDNHVKSAVRALALWIFTEKKGAPLSRNQIQTYVADYLSEKKFDDENDARDAAEQFFDFCSGRSWVIAETGRDIFEFSHRTFLEYFAASELVRQAPDPARLWMLISPHVVHGEWAVVSDLSVQILNETVDDGADSLIGILVDESKRSLEDRLPCAQFATRLLKFVSPKAATLEKVVHTIWHYYERWEHGWYENEMAQQDLSPPDLTDSPVANPLVDLERVSDENWPLVSKYLIRIALEASLEPSASRQKALKLLWFHDVLSVTGQSQHWIDTVGARRDGARPSMLDLFRSESWVAGELLVAGDIRPAEFFANHAARALYASIEVDGRVVLPAAVRMAIRCTQEQTAPSTTEAAELASTLVATARRSTIRVSPQGDKKSIANALSARSPLKEPDILSLFVMLCLPYVGAISEPLGLPLDTLKGLQGIYHGADAPARVIRHLGVNPETESYLTGWASRVSRAGRSVGGL